jgi:hypothetical protein
MEKTKTTYCKVATSKFLEHDSNSHTRLEGTTDTVSSPKRLDLVGSSWPLTKTLTRENAFHHGLYASLALHVAFALTDLVGTPQTHDLVCCFLHTNSKSDRLKGSPAGLDEFYSLVLVAQALAGNLPTPTCSDPIDSPGEQRKAFAPKPTSDNLLDFCCHPLASVLTTTCEESTNCSLERDGCLLRSPQAKSHSTAKADTGQEPHKMNHFLGPLAQVPTLPC